MVHSWEESILDRQLNGAVKHGMQFQSLVSILVQHVGREQAFCQHEHVEFIAMIDIVIHF